jgi:hypothetical protein
MSQTERQSEYYQRQQAQLEAQRIAQRVRAGERVPITQIARVAKRHPEYLTKTTPIEEAQWLQQQRREAGPIAGGRERPPAEQPKSLTQQIMELKNPPLRTALENIGVLQKTPFDFTFGKTGVGFEAGKQAVAAGVGAFESPVYAVGTFIGVKGLPEPPITATGGLISTVISKEGPVVLSFPTVSGLVSKAVMGKKSAVQKQIEQDLGLARKETAEIHYTPEMEYLVEHPPYAIGSILGEVALAYGISKGFGYAKGKISELTRPKLPAPGVVDVPDIGYTSPRTMSEKVLGLPELKAPYQLKGLGPLEAEATAMELGIAPKTALIDPLAELVEPPTLVKPIAGMPWLPTPELTAKLPVKSVIPKLISFAGLSGLSATRAGPKAPLDVPTQLKPEMPTRFTFDTRPEISLKMDTEYALGLKSGQSVSQIAESITKQVTIQQVSTRQLQRQLQIQKQIQIPDFDFKKEFAMPKPSRQRKRGTGLYLWEFPIADPSKLLKLF